jgi:hypothetical protein
MTWLADNWTELAALAIAATGLLVLCWALRGDDYRTRNDRTAARHVTSGPRPEPGVPGINEALLAACNQLCPDLARKED